MLPLFHHLNLYFNIFNKEGKIELQMRIPGLLDQKVPCRSLGLPWCFTDEELEGMKCWMRLLTER